MQSTAISLDRLERMSKDDKEFERTKRKVNQLEKENILLYKKNYKLVEKNNELNKRFDLLEEYLIKRREILANNNQKFASEEFDKIIEALSYEKNNELKENNN